MNIITLILSLMLPAPHVLKEPQGYLDCEFDARTVYICRPDAKHGNQ